MPNQIKQTGLQEVVNQQAEPAEPSASCVPPIPPREQQGPPEQSLLEDRRPEVPWVAAVAERLEKPISQHRQKYAPGQKSWAAASQQYARFDGPAQPSTTPSNINEIALDPRWQQLQQSCPQLAPRWASQTQPSSASGTPW